MILLFLSISKNGYYVLFRYRLFSITCKLFNPFPCSFFSAKSARATATLFHSIACIDLKVFFTMFSNELMTFRLEPSIRLTGLIESTNLFPPLIPSPTPDTRNRILYFNFPYVFRSIVFAYLPWIPFKHFNNIEPSSSPNVRRSTRMLIPRYFTAFLKASPTIATDFPPHHHIKLHQPNIFYL
ncbi:hypothetical protein ACVW18_003133 [Bacillus thuringiensis]